MEFINKIELCGIVGTSRNNKVGELTETRFSLQVSSSYGNGGGFIISNTWFYCTAWSDKCPSASEISKGDIVHVYGRVHQFTYQTSDGEVRGWEVKVHELDIVKKGGDL